MSTLLRFVDTTTDPDTVLFDLNDPDGIFIANLDMGGVGTASTWLDAPGEDGAEMASSSRPLSTIRVDIHVAGEASSDAVLALWADLVTELDKDRNVLEYRPLGASASEIIDTFRADIPSLYSGADIHAFLNKRTQEPLTLLIPRWPTARSGAYV